MHECEPTRTCLKVQVATTQDDLKPQAPGRHFCHTASETSLAHRRETLEYNDAFKAVGSGQPSPIEAIYSTQVHIAIQNTNTTHLFSMSLNPQKQKEVIYLIYPSPTNQKKRPRASLNFTEQKSRSPHENNVCSTTASCHKDLTSSKQVRCLRHR